MGTEKFDTTILFLNCKGKKLTIKELREKIELDKKQWRKELGKKNVNFFFLFIFLREYKIVYLFRLCEYLRSHFLLFIPYCCIRLLYHHVTLTNGADIPSHAEIGGGWVIHHCNGIVIHPLAKIGKNFVIRSGCVIGCKGDGVPIIENNVNLGVHSIIIGNITVSSGCIIGAGSVVNKSTEPNGSYAGVPAYRIK